LGLLYYLLTVDPALPDLLTKPWPTNNYHLHTTLFTQVMQNTYSKFENGLKAINLQDP